MHTPLQRTLWLGLVLCGLLATRTEAASITIDFSTGTAGIVGSPYTDSGTNLKADAFYLTGGVWTPTDLFRRNDNVDDLGFGVCSPGETCSTPTNTGGAGLGDANELDN